MRAIWNSCASYGVTVCVVQAFAFMVGLFDELMQFFESYRILGVIFSVFFITFRAIVLHSEELSQKRDYENELRNAPVRKRREGVKHRRTQPLRMRR